MRYKTIAVKHWPSVYPKRAPAAADIPPNTRTPRKRKKCSAEVDQEDARYDFRSEMKDMSTQLRLMTVNRSPAESRKSTGCDTIPPIRSGRSAAADTTAERTEETSRKESSAEPASRFLCVVDEVRDLPGEDVVQAAEEDQGKGVAVDDDGGEEDARLGERGAGVALDEEDAEHGKQPRPGHDGGPRQAHPENADDAPALEQRASARSRSRPLLGLPRKLSYRFHRTA